ncbi:MAG: hypothetical protein ONB16_13635 [candidate division KSB1 bacterium]|nr:hypothetical protein [candidate division KSB1 bacterium]MDZ7339871.1 hypothetical protein [candidate division KSB1 bacterium]
MQRKKSLIALLLFLMAPLLFAFPSEFYDEAIDQWIGDSWFNETSIQPSTNNELYLSCFDLNTMAHRVQIQIFDNDDGIPEHNFYFYFTNSGSTPTFRLGQSDHQHICRIQVWGISQYAQTAGYWSVFSSIQE